MATNTTAPTIQPLQLISPETIDKLTAGFLGLLEPEVVRVQQSLEELT